MGLAPKAAGSHIQTTSLTFANLAGELSVWGCGGKSSETAQECNANRTGTTHQMRLDIGAGTILQEGWTALDPVHGEGGWKRRAEDAPWPVDDGGVEELRASHVMEHIHAGADRITVMNEAHRALKSGGIFTIIVPIFNGGWQAIADPTHVSFWVEESFHYFDSRLAPNAHYGIRPWQTESLDTLSGWECHWVGRKP